MMTMEQVKKTVTSANPDFSNFRELHGSQGKMSRMYLADLGAQTYVFKVDAAPGSPHGIRNAQKGLNVDNEGRILLNFPLIEAIQNGIVPLTHIYRHNGSVILGKPFIENAQTLADLVKDENTALSKKEILSIASQTVDRMIYSKGKGSYHRDVSPTNILLTKDRKKYNVLLIDPANGCSLDHKLSDALPTCGSATVTDPFVSPRFTDNPHQDPELSDIYAIGKNILYMALGYDPFRINAVDGKIELSGIDDFLTNGRIDIEKYEAALRKIKDQFPRKLRPLWDIAYKCLQKPEKRIGSFEKLLSTIDSYSTFSMAEFLGKHWSAILSTAAATAFIAIPASVMMNHHLQRSVWAEQNPGITTYIDGPEIRNELFELVANPFNLIKGTKPTDKHPYVTVRPGETLSIRVRVKQTPKLHQILTESQEPEDRWYGTGAMYLRCRAYLVGQSGKWTNREIEIRTLAPDENQEVRYQRGHDQSRPVVSLSTDDNTPEGVYQAAVELLAPKDLSRWEKATRRRFEIEEDQILNRIRIPVYVSENPDAVEVDDLAYISGARAYSNMVSIEIKDLKDEWVKHDDFSFMMTREDDPTRPISFRPSYCGYWGNVRISGLLPKDLRTGNYIFTIRHEQGNKESLMFLPLEYQRNHTTARFIHAKSPPTLRIGLPGDNYQKATEQIRQHAQRESFLNIANISRTSMR